MIQDKRFSIRIWIQTCAYRDPATDLAKSLTYGLCQIGVVDQAFFSLHLSHGIICYTFRSVPNLVDYQVVSELKLEGKSNSMALRRMISFIGSHQEGFGNKMSCCYWEEKGVSIATPIQWHLIC